MHNYSTGFASHHKVPSERVVNFTLPAIRGKHIHKLLSAFEDNVRLKSLLNKYERKNPALVLSLRIHSGNTGQRSADALQQIFWYENKVAKWDSDDSKENLLAAFKVLIGNALMIYLMS